VGGSELFHAKYQPLLFEAVHLPYPCRYHWQGNRARCLEESVAQVKQVIEEQHDKIAALIIEPLLQGASGMLSAEPGFLRQIRDLCDTYDVLMIVDEVATGFGKTGKMFACEHEQVSPDLMCVAKGLTGGYLPVAATLTSQKVFDGFLGEYEEKKTFFHGHSYTGNQLGCAAALASLEVFEKEETLKRLEPKIQHLGHLLKEIETLKHVGDVRRVGIMTGIELVRDKKTAQPFEWKDQVAVRVCRDMVSKGFLIRPLGNVVILMPPLSITQDELSRTVTALKASIQQITEEQKTSANV
jgi:adenosylmethionine-8-amino-7-oxononanoate aminotransferase